MPEQWIGILRPIARVQRDELSKTLLMFIYFFLTITSYYILKPVRDSVFITQYGAENLPWVWLTTVFILSLVASVYVKFVDYLQKNVLLSSTVIFFVINLAIFRWLAQYELPWTGFVFFIWVSIFSVMVVTQFWLYANDLFNPREAKRLFGIVGSGGILGGIAGGAITSQFATVVGTQNLLLVAGFILLLCVLLIQAIWQTEQEKSRLAETQKLPEEMAGLRETRKFIALIWKKRYLVLLVSLVFLAKAVSTLVEYQFKNVVQDEILGMDVRTAFFGKFYVWLNTASFLTQFFLTARILRYFGVRSALLVLPAGLLLGSAGLFFEPVLWIATGVAMYDGSLNYSLNNSSREVLYLPIFREIRYRVKPFIDMVSFRFAKGTMSVVILLLTKAMGFDERQLSLVALLLIIFWFLTIRTMKHEYPNALREFLAAEAAPSEPRTQAPPESHLLSACLQEFTQGREVELLRGMLPGSVHEQRVIVSEDRSAIQIEIESEIAKGYGAQHILRAFHYYEKQAREKGDDVEKEAFIAAQEGRIAQVLERVFDLLNFISEPRDMKMIYAGLLDRNPQVKANAVELLDTVLTNPLLKSSILGLLDGESSAAPFFMGSKQTRLIAAQQPGLQHPRKFLKQLLQSEDAWNFLSGSYIVLRFGLKEFRSEVDSLTRGRGPLVSELARLLRDKLAA